jgi:hypothetical protein
LQSPPLALHKIVNGTPSRYCADAESDQSLTSAPVTPGRRFHGSSYDPLTLATWRMSKRDGPYKSALRSAMPRSRSVTNVRSAASFIDR